MHMWGYWSEEWRLADYVSFNGDTKKIYINPNVISVKVKDDIYSAWVRWVEINENYRYLPAFRYIGGDPTGDGQYSGEMFFLMNGWQIVIDHNVSVDGIIYHDDGIPVYDVVYGGVTGKVAAIAYAYGSDIPKSAVDLISQKIVESLPSFPTPEEIAAVIVDNLPSNVTAEQVAQAVWSYTK